MRSYKKKSDECISELKATVGELNSRLSSLNELCEGKTRLYVSAEDLQRMQLLANQSQEALKWLEEYNRRLYQNRGKTSPKKAVSSQSNGKLGGRPPKEISQARRRVEELEEKSALTAEEEIELKSLNEKIIEWKYNKT